MIEAAQLENCWRLGGSFGLPGGKQVLHIVTVVVRRQLASFHRHLMLSLIVQAQRANLIKDALLCTVIVPAAKLLAP
jgi:hypothetical protein